MDLSRRKLIGIGAGSAGAAVAGGAFILAGSGSAFAAEFSAEDTEATTDDGKVNKVSVYPDLAVTLDGLDTPVNQVEVKLESRTENETEFSRADDPAFDGDILTYTPFDGAVTSTDGAVAIIGQEEEVILRDSHEGFNVPQDGQTETTEVTIRATVQVTNSTGEYGTADSFAGNKLVAEDTGEATFQVAVTNEESSASASGGFSTTAE